MAAAALESANRKILACPYERDRVTGNLVVGEGNPHARLLIVGEAPGRREDETGRPFVGRSGKLLDRVLLKSGLDRKDLYITSILKYFPGKRAITWEEMLHGRQHLMDQLSAIKPELILVLGNTALKGLSLSKDAAITKSRGKVTDCGPFRCLPTFHPAAVLRTGGRLLPFFEKDLGLAGKLINQPS